jgi:serine protease Do
MHEMSVLQELQQAVEAAGGAIGPSVVGIGRRLRGSGIVIADGQVLTNAHNVRGAEVTVTFAGGRQVRGAVRGVDWDGDLAVVEVDTAGAPAIAWGDPAAVSIGSAVFGAAAAPGGATRVTFGLVSAMARSFRGPGGRRIAGSIEHTAPLAPGASGGPLVNAAGEVVGLNTNRIGEGFYLALPADAALRDRIAALGRGEAPKRRRLGVAVAPGHVARRLRRSVGLPERDGVLVRDVDDGSPAAAAGIAIGDLVVSVAGRDIGDADDLVDALNAAEPPFEVGLVRGADDLRVTVEADGGGEGEGAEGGEPAPGSGGLVN